MGGRAVATLPFAAAAIWQQRSLLLQFLVVSVALILVTVAAWDHWDELIVDLPAIFVPLGVALLLYPPRYDVRPTAFALLVVPLGCSTSWRRGWEAVPALWFGWPAKALLLAVFAFLFALNWRRVADRQGRLLALVAAIAIAVVTFLLPIGASAALVLLALAYTLGSRTLAAIGALARDLFHLELLLGPAGDAADQVHHPDGGGRGSAAVLWAADRRAARTEADMKRTRWTIALAGLALILALANWDIAQKRAVIADGQVLLLELRPADPRSLFQGDYMALALADEAMPGADVIADLPYRGTVILALDENRVGRYARLDDGSPLKNGELRVQYRRHEDWRGTEAGLWRAVVLFPGRRRGTLRARPLRDAARRGRRQHGA